MYSTCRRCQTVKRPRDTPDPCIATSIASYAGVVQNFSEDFVRGESSLSLSLDALATVIMTSLAIATPFYGKLLKKYFSSFFLVLTDATNPVCVRRLRDAKIVMKDEDLLKCQTHLSKYRFEKSGYFFYWDFT